MTRSDARTSRPRRAYAARVPAPQRRAQLLDAALHLVVTRGHQAVTMEAVAEQVGVNQTGRLRSFRQPARPAGRTAAPGARRGVAAAAGHVPGGPPIPRDRTGGAGETGRTGGTGGTRPNLRNRRNRRSWRSRRSLASSR